MIPDLRKIAERLITYNTNPDHFALVEMVSAADIAALLNALVEEKARYLFTYNFSSVTMKWEELGDEVDRLSAEKGTKMTKLYWRTQALRQLNLEGAWPRKEKNGRVRLET